MEVISQALERESRCHLGRIDHITDSNTDLLHSCRLLEAAIVVEKNS